MTSETFTADRREPLAAGSEQDQLESWVDFHRDTLLGKCQGLSAEQLRRRPCEPSTLSLLGLVRHLADVEAWFNDDLTDEQRPALYSSAEDPDGEFDNVDDADPEADAAAFRRAVEQSKAFTAAHRDLDQVIARGRNGDDRPLRWVYLHMIEEYARHNGHADLLRERIDGATGE